MAEWVLEPLHDDLNTPLALSRLRDLRTLENALTVGGSAKVVLDRMGLEREPAAGVAAAASRDAAKVVGLAQSDPAAWLEGRGDVGIAAATGMASIKFSVQGTGSILYADIESAITARLAARKAKNWAEADRIRDDLKSKGIILEDGPSGTTWRRA
jgi:cysteinyl-tRNA synthetase